MPSDRAIIDLPVWLPASRIAHCRVDVLARKTRIRIEKIRLGSTLAELAKNKLDRDPRAADHGLAEHHAPIHVDAVGLRIHIDIVKGFTGGQHVRFCWSTTSKSIARTNRPRRACWNAAPTSIVSSWITSSRASTSAGCTSTTRTARTNDGHPDRTADEIREWALEHDLPYFDDEVQLLDAVLTTPHLEWLTTVSEKGSYLARLKELPGVETAPETPADATSRTASQLSATFPIGLEQDGRAVLLYLATEPWTDGFRSFLQAHAALPRVAPTWTLRLVFPRPLDRVYDAYQAVIREELESPLHPATINELKWYFEHRREAVEGPVHPMTRGFL